MKEGDPLSFLEAHGNEVLEDLVQLCRIPGISRYEENWKDLGRSADLTARYMKEAGLGGVEVIPLPGGPPYVYGEWLGAGPKAPTALLYAHHDVQPVGDESKWVSPPFEPTVRGGRLYGRGTVDDKAGIVIHLAAIEGYLKTIGRLPLNLKFIVEGDEESGSRTLSTFLSRYRKKLQADLLCLTDLGNLETGLPSLTYSLRGAVSARVTVTTARHPLHSGMWGGVLPDAALALSKLLGTLIDDRGIVQVKGFYDDLIEPTEREREEIQRLPWDESHFREDAGVLEGVKFIGDPHWTPYERMWLRPTLDVLALESSSMKGYSNQLVPVAEAVVSCRLVPNQNPEKVQELLKTHLIERSPFGAKVEVKPRGAAPPWRTRPEGPVFDAARRALSKGFGRETVLIGAGGSVPFVFYFNQAFGDIPTLLLGVEDPPCAAHAENESLDLGDFKKAMVSSVYLYDELSRVGIS